MGNPFLGNLRRERKLVGPTRLPEVLTLRSLKEAISTAILPVGRNEKPQWATWNTKKAIDEGFKASTWVYAAVSRISTAAASPPWVVQEEREEEGKVVEVPVASDVPLQALLQRPNPFMSMNDIVRRAATHLYLGGNAIITKIRAGNATGQKGLQRARKEAGTEADVGKPVVELWPIHPGYVAPVPSRTDYLKEYELKNPDGGKGTILKVENVIHIQLVDPEHPFWGMSPLQAASRTVDADVKAVEWNMVAMSNRSVPDGVFTLDMPMSRDQWEEARDMVKEQYQDTDNARTPWILGNAAKWEPMSLSPAEMDFIESRKLTREEILSVFGVPPPLVGLYEQATLANIKTAREIFWLDTIIPFLDVIRATLERSLIPDFYDEQTAQTISVNYDTSNVDALQEDLGQKMETAQAMWESGVPWSMINDRLELGMAPWPGWDIPYVPTNMVPAGEGSGIDDALEGVL